LVGADYEFRFRSHGTLLAVHIVRLTSDTEACARARRYLEASPEFESVIVRSGFRFMREITLGGEVETEKSSRLLS
jgi:hypothetical protein